MAMVSDCSCTPLTKTTVSINSPDPFIQVTLFDLILFCFLTFSFQYKRFATGQPDQEVRAIFTHYPAVNIKYFKPKVIISNGTSCSMPASFVGEIITVKLFNLVA